MPEIGKKPLAPEELAYRCDPALFGFDTTGELGLLTGIIGQERALKSIEFGLGITNHNYNIYVLGETGTGKATTIKGVVEGKAGAEPVPDDWCYVFNFRDPDSPAAISLPPGKGAELVEQMEELIGTLRRDIPQVFESKDYEKHRDEIVEGQQERTRAIFLRLEQRAADKGFILKKSVSGLSMVPGKNGKPMSQEEQAALSREKRAEMEEDLRVLQDKLSDAVREARAIDKETKERINELDREVVQYVVNPHVADLLERFKDHRPVLDYVNDARADILARVDDFRGKDEMPISIGPMRFQRQEPSFERYAVNLIVNNGGSRGAPVVYETNPTYYNLFGRLEYRVQFGVATTDFTMIRAGSAHRANGGYLIVNALDILRNIFVYDSLKRMLKNRELKIEDVWEQYRLVSSSTMKPQPIPVKLKLIVIGEPYLYYLLYNLDSEYRKLFKVKSDFDVTMPRTPEAVDSYAQFVATRCKEEGLLPFDRAAVARVVEHGCRLAADKEKLTARFNDVHNLVVEASYWASSSGAKVVSSEHVEKADSERVFRASRIEDKLRDYIKDDVLMVDTEGAVAGQVNGIAVLDLGDYAFGKPSRITARTFMGDSGVVNIEREVKMSGKIHSKALLILSGFLGDRFAQRFPITLSASIGFEQLYEEIEGDSATCAEVYALMSSLADAPIDQGLAVTGSMNQKGEVQPIGGVNEKVEGFFDVCKAKGLTGKQGVVIPRRNVRNLMLRREVVEAVEAGRFAVYAIDYVDEGLEILTGIEAGKRGKDGTFPEGTLNRRVHDRLLALAKSHKEFGRPVPEKKAKGDEQAKPKDEEKKTTTTSD